MTPTITTLNDNDDDDATNDDDDDVTNDDDDDDVDSIMVALHLDLEGPFYLFHGVGCCIAYCYAFHLGLAQYYGTCPCARTPLLTQHDLHTCIDTCIDTWTLT